MAKTIEEMPEYLNGLRDQNYPALHIGCGNYIYPNAINIDKYDLAEKKPDLICDAVKLPYMDCSISMIETHQMIEHLSYQELLDALREWNRVLRPAGYLVVSTFDMERIINGYPMEMVRMNVMAWRAVGWMIYGSQEHEGHYHKSLHTPEYTSKLFEKYGFVTEDLIIGYPQRPTPTFTIIARKMDWPVVTEEEAKTFNYLYIGEKANAVDRDPCN